MNWNKNTMKATKIGTILTDIGYYPTGAEPVAPRGELRELEDNNYSSTPSVLNYEQLIKKRNKTVESMFRRIELKKISKKQLRTIIINSTKEDILTLLTDLGYTRRI